MRPLVAVLLLAGLLFGGSEQAASAPNEQDLPNASSVRMDVRAGFDGSGRVGGWVPLDVNLVNEGSELNANVQVVIDQPGGRSTYSFVPTTFSLPGRLAAPEQSALHDGSEPAERQQQSPHRATGALPRAAS